MITDDPLVAGDPHALDAFADAWAAVFIDVYEKMKEHGELPDDADDLAFSQYDKKSPVTKIQQGELLCSST
jgi:hypothetical protein